MENSKRRVGRPKSEPRNGPLVLDEDRDRQKTEVELTAATARELGEYAAWVEMSSSLTTADATFTTVEFALRDLFGVTASGESGDTPPRSIPLARRRRHHLRHRRRLPRDRRPRLPSLPPPSLREPRTTT